MSCIALSEDAGYFITLKPDFLSPQPKKPAKRTTRCTPAERAAINRANARKSTGPRTAEGKARSRCNALKSGRYAQKIEPAWKSIEKVRPDDPKLHERRVWCATPSPLDSECENDPTWGIWFDELEKELKPRSPVEQTLFEQYADVAWTMRRLAHERRQMYRLIQADGQPGCHVGGAMFAAGGYNAVATFERHARAMRNQAMRLLNALYKAKKTDHLGAKQRNDELAQWLRSEERTHRVPAGAGENADWREIGAERSEGGNSW